MNKIFKLIAALFLVQTYFTSFSMGRKCHAPADAQEEDYMLAQAMQESLNLEPNEAKHHRTHKKTELSEQNKYLNTKRNPKVNQTIDSIGHKEFQLSLRDAHFNLPTFIDKNNKGEITNVYFEGVPLIGIYNGDNYNMLNRVALIQNRQRMLKTAPESLSKELGENKQVDFFTAIYSIPRSTKNSVYNLVFHPWARTLKKGAKDEKNFSVKLPMGIFNGNGVQRKGTAPIAFDKFNPEDVVIHPVGNGETAFSPNNAHFDISPSRQVSTFWSAAMSPDKKRAVVVFNILFNNQTNAPLIMAITKYSNTMGELLNNLVAGSENLKQEDKNALLNAAGSINNMLK